MDLVHFTILRPPDKHDGVPVSELSLIAFPTRELFETKIDDFDLIIFDRYTQQSILPLAYLQNIVRYVRNGGALFVSAGPEFAGPDGLAGTPLQAILPATPDGQMAEKPFRPQITEIGAKHPVTQTLPGSGSPPEWGEWTRQILSQSTQGSVVMSGDNAQPLLVLNREGKGRVALLLSDHAWLWARNFRGGGPYVDLLRNTVHWLMKEPQLEEEALRASAKPGNTACDTRLARNRRRCTNSRVPARGHSPPITRASSSGSSHQTRSIGSLHSAPAGPAMSTQVAAPSDRQQLLLAKLRLADRELSGQDLHALLRQGSQPMGLATVYRHLRQLQQRGWIRCRHLPSGEALFAPTERDEHHLTCVDCGATVVLNNCPMHDVHLDGGQSAGFQLLFHTLEFFGLCGSCQQRQAS